jgi:hypothetical protein
MFAFNTFFRAIFNKNSDERTDCFGSVAKFINTLCVVTIYIVFPVYILFAICIPLWQLDSSVVLDPIGQDFLLVDDKAFDLLMYLMAGNSAGYCILELFGVNWLTDRKKPNVILLRLFGTFFETLFFVCVRNFVTETYAMSVLFAVVVRFIESISFCFLSFEKEEKKRDHIC